MLYQAGGTILDEKGKPQLNSPQAIEALTLTDLLNKDKTVYLVREFEGQNDFLAGIVAMYEGSSVSITQVRQQPINFNIGYARYLLIEQIKAPLAEQISLSSKAEMKKENGVWNLLNGLPIQNRQLMECRNLLYACAEKCYAISRSAEFFKGLSSISRDL